ncbi:TPA: thioredoxin family protein [Candidatus Galligastranaerophilus intestinavium]|uniref:Thioredoxin family protein n=1 Tax=Candidatus Galligastranaerophilus intestinavium TaxID=2840836 RepID=A0A9D1FHM6_9BACT|nr:thioredoxin family protein [Candidatus Galligastranaerophilus intestinavium]
MKNWIIVLLVFAIPLGLYAYLESNSQSTVAKEEVSMNNTQKPRVIKFYSPMCSDCKKISNEMVGVVEDYKDAVTFEEINVSEQTDKNKALIKKYKITLVPTLVFESKDGKTFKKVEGFIEDDEIENNIVNIK